MKLCLACGNSFVSSEWLCPFCGGTPEQVDGFLAFAPELARNNPGFHSEYFEKLMPLEVRNFWFQARSNLIIKALQRYFPSFESFFEIGCGTGFVLSKVRTAFPQAVLVGSEIYTAGLACAARRVAGAELLQMDARRLPFESHFDVIGAFDVLEHIEEDEIVLNEMYKALKPRGGIILTVPQHPWLWSYQDEVACHVRRYTAEDIRRKVMDAGFDIVRMTSFVFFLLPFMWVSRRLTRRKFSDPLAELKIGTPLNEIFKVVMKLEEMVIELGVDFPAGGSLLIVAKKR
jgi:SAM-dependent methyltransferase